jgi:hypothetical protein
MSTIPPSGSLASRAARPRASVISSARSRAAAASPNRTNARTAAAPRAVAQRLTQWST